MQFEPKFLGETAREWNLSLLKPMSRLLGQLCKRENSRFYLFTAICLFTALWPFDLRPNKVSSNGPPGCRAGGQAHARKFTQVLDVGLTLRELAISENLASRAWPWCFHGASFFTHHLHRATCRTVAKLMRIRVKMNEKVLQLRSCKEPDSMRKLRARCNMCFCRGSRADGRRCMGLGLGRP